jgi:hypothetical protein
MPSAPKHALAITVSLDRDMTEEELHMVKDVILRSKNVRFVTAIAEIDDNGRVHFHAGVIMHQNRSITPGNFKHGTLMGSPYIRDMLSTLATEQYAIKVKDCYSDGWIAHYMDKGENEYVYTNMPGDMMEIEYAFTDIVVKKSANPQMEKYMRMYSDEARPIPASLIDVESFFRYHWYREMDLKIVEARKRSQLYDDMRNCLNADDTVPERKRKRDDEWEDPYPRLCPRCPEDLSPQKRALGPREQFCSIHKKC